MIEFKDVSKKFGESEPVLDKINFFIDKGSFVYLIGPTGSGKTTVFRLIIRDLFPTEGLITLGEWDLAKLPKSKIPHLRRKVGVVFQDLKLLIDRTVAENVMLPLEFSGTREEEAKRRAEEILISVGLEEKQNKFPLQLSGGEKQRTAIARALVFDPEIILADEPTGNLDVQTSFQILELLESINKKGTTVFMATHNDKLINDLKYRIISLNKGRIIEDRKPKTKHEEHEKTHKKNPKDDKDESLPARPDEDLAKRAGEAGKKDLPAGKKDKIKLETLASSR